MVDPDRKALERSGIGLMLVREDEEAPARGRDQLDQLADRVRRRVRIGPVKAQFELAAPAL